jgi:predicted amidohydrolase
LLAHNRLILGVGPLKILILGNDVRYILFSLLLFGLTGCGSARTPIPADALVVINGTVIDGTGVAPILDGIVIIENKRIKAVGQATDFASRPFETTVIDAHGGTILPGFINAHVHQTASPRTRRLYLVEGVTAVCDLGTPLNRMPQFEQEQTRQTLERVS